MRVEDVEVITNRDLGRPYKVLGPIKARVTAGAAWNKARTVEDVNSKLREVALGMGANAVVGTSYQRGASATSWKALTATGTAVVAETVDRACPYCAEHIKREARVCRFCGRDIEPLEPIDASGTTDAAAMDAVRRQFPAFFDQAMVELWRLPSQPPDQVAWMTGVCSRLRAGESLRSAVSNESPDAW
jgi:hypothetical protein